MDTIKRSTFIIQTNRAVQVTTSAALAGVILVVLLCLLGSTSPVARAAEGDIICVTAAGGSYAGCDQTFTAVQEAVDAAAGGETIQVAAGIYTDMHQRRGITQVVYLTKSVTIRGGYSADFSAWDPQSYSTTLDAGRLGRALVITGTITPTVEGLRITGGDASGLGGYGGDPISYDAGGGVYVYAATPAISGCVIYSNTASTVGCGLGGGLYLDGVSVLQGNTLQENVASTADIGQGGGMYVRSANGTSLSGNTLLTNTASTAGAGSGGGVYLRRSDATLVGNVFQGNVGSKATNGWGYGGGLHAYISNVTLTGNIICGNAAGALYSAHGGGVYLRGAEATLMGNWIVGNAASQDSSYTGRGGGVYVYTTRVLTLVNNVVADNYADDYGSGLYIDGEPTDPVSARFLHNTIADNQGYISGLHLGDHTTALMTNTILAGHTNVALRVDAGSTATLEATLWYGNGSLTFGDGTIVSATNVYSAPGFVDPGAWDYHLAAGSAAIDRGVNSGVTVDIDGDARPAGACDLGADEYWHWQLVFLPLVLRND
ncbi:MAG: choice-of-anchor Q domain-containing protein [Anaerolineae bacterium]|jgi:hypothetical protein